MNVKQKIALSIGLLLIVAMAAYPPWREETGKKEVAGASHYTTTPSNIVSGGYDFIFDPPRRATGIDLGRLSVQLVTILALTAGVVILLHRRKEEGLTQHPWPLRWKGKKSLLAALLAAVIILSAVVFILPAKKNTVITDLPTPAKTEVPPPPPPGPAPAKAPAPSPSLPARGLKSDVTAAKVVVSAAGRFIARDNGIVLDTKTGLMWAARDNGRNVDWAGARSYCENYRGGGIKGWRMPTQDELAGLYAGGAHKDMITNISLLWAADTRGSHAAALGFGLGERLWMPRATGNLLRVLPVRRTK